MTLKQVPKLVSDAVEQLLQRFEAGDYNPTPLIDLGALVANADGTVDHAELEALRGILEPMLHTELDDELVGFLVDASVKVIKADGWQARMRVVAEILKDCDAAEQAITVALAVAFASDGYSDAERNVVTALAEATEVPRARLDALVESVRSAYPS